MCTTEVCLNRSKHTIIVILYNWRTYNGPLQCSCIHTYGCINPWKSISFPNANPSRRNFGLFFCRFHSLCGRSHWNRQILCMKTDGVSRFICVSDTNWSRQLNGWWLFRTLRSIHNIIPHHFGDKLILKRPQMYKCVRVSYNNDVGGRALLRLHFFLSGGCGPRRHHHLLLLHYFISINLIHFNIECVREFLFRMILYA